MTVDRAQPEARGFDANSLVNALSVAMVACLIPVQPWTENLYLSCSTLVFAGLAVLNHLWPRHLNRLTHPIKAAYTHLLFASLATPPLWIPILVSIFDLVPLGLREGRARVVCEGIGGVTRWVVIAYAFFTLHFPPALTLGFGLCAAIYAWERGQRIAAGRRHDYGLAHSLEHLATWWFLVVLNGPRLDLPRVWGLSLGLLLTLALALIVAGVTINILSFYAVRRSLPPWFEPRLRPAILAKARDNVFSHRLQHYVLKPFTPKMTTQRVRWADMETMVRAVELSGTHDCVVGVLSGGAFMARYVALHHGITQVHYARSRLWSKLSLLRNLVTSTRYYLGADNVTRASFLDPEVDLSGQRVLIVDDSVCTGATLATVTQLCRDRGAAEVETLALFCNQSHPTNYYYRMSMTPLIWPWGWESD